MNIAQYIDHTYTKPDATRERVIQFCDEAKQYGFFSVCANPYWARLCAEQLAGSGVKTCVVVGYPLGANLSVIKAQETLLAVEAGADEIDMVMNIGELKSGRFDFCRQDIETVRKAAPKPIVLKVILEACLLTDEEKVRACEIAELAGADFVKTSTGFGASGATVEDVQLMRKTVGNRLGVKAADGIKTYVAAKAMIGAGANRLGCKHSVTIVNEAAKAKE